MENPAPKDATRQVSKVPPGSNQDRGMHEEKRTDDRPAEGGTLNSGRLAPPPSEEIYLQRINDFQPKEGIAKGAQESDPPIVVSDGSTGHTAKGRAGKQRKQSTHHGTRLLPTTVSSSLLAKGTGFWHFVSALVPCARFPEEPGAVIPHAGICEGGTG